MRSCSFALALAVANFPLFGQSLSLGVMGGVRVTHDFGEPNIAGTVISESRPYLAGPMALLSLPHGFGIEFDALYQRIGYTANLSACCNLSFVSRRERDNAWEFPLLGRYRIPARVFKPFVEVGWAPRMTHGSSVDNATLLTLPYPTYISSTTRMTTHWPTTQGVVAGGGVEIDAGRLRLAPQVRYTHWNQPTISGAIADGPSYASSQNDVDILLEISWRVVQSRR